MPNKRNEICNAAAPLNGFIVRKIPCFGIKRLSLNQVKEMTLGFFMLNKGTLCCRLLRYGNFDQMIKDGAQHMRWHEVVFDKNWSKGIRLMLCSLGGLLTYAARDEMESSSCSFVIAPSLMLSTTCVFGTKGNNLVLMKSGPLIQLLDCKTSADIPHVPASAGLSQVATWFHWSPMVFSRISLTRFAKKMGCLFVALIHFKTMMLSVDIKTLSTVTVNARQISHFKRAARRAACSSNLRAVITFLGLTRALPETNASSVIVVPEVQTTWALRTALNMGSSRCWNGPEK